ncbi:MAG: LCP family protein [Blautia sp.]|nr:LCP family protein [Blautia sp.]MCM1201025.1 LCP family protein [Bacteroides fragilis]
MNGQKKWKLSIPLLILEVLVLAVAIGILYVVTTATNEIERTAIDEENIVINEEVAETKTEKEKEQEETEEVKKGYRNIALFGVDARDGELGRGTRSDTIIIASINQDTHEIKLVSVYRDTYLNLGNDSYNKCNGAYAKGGPEQAITMLNMNLDMDITDYVTVGFSGLIDAIDCLGGIEIEIMESEINHLNNYQLCMAEEMGIDYTPVTKTGLQTLNGMQATAYCRIRYTKGDDFKRAERQRDVLGAMMLKAKDASLSTLREVVTSVLPSVNTSLNVNEIISVLGTVAEYEVVESEGFPFQSERTNASIGSKGDCIIPTTLEENVMMLHELLYTEEEYTPSKQVVGLSEEIEQQTVEFIR